ncbi:MAG: ABC transporter ATP-binding protein [Planctomycetota bacterium]
MNEPILSIHGLTKSYGSVRALDGLTLSIPAGPVGLLGPNGAGKTTLIKLLLGLLEPDAGEARVAGCNPRRASERLELRRRVGYMPESDCLLPRMNAVELTAALGRLSGLAKEDAMKRAHEVLDYVGLDEARYRSTEEYSTGMKQRLKLAQALVHDPPLLLLDEPTNGLDPKARRHMLDLVHDLGHAQGKSFLFCSHLLPDVERTCRDVVVLKQGHVQKSGAIADLTKTSGRAFRVRVAPDAHAFRARLASASHAVTDEPDGALVVRLPDSTPDADILFELAAESGAVITEIAPIRSTLQAVFLEEMARPELAARGDTS